MAFCSILHALSIYDQVFVSSPAVYSKRFQTEDDMVGTGKDWVTTVC